MHDQEVPIAADCVSPLALTFLSRPEGGAAREFAGRRAAIEQLGMLGTTPQRRAEEDPNLSLALPTSRPERSDQPERGRGHDLRKFLQVSEPSRGRTQHI